MKYQIFEKNCPPSELVELIEESNHLRAELSRLSESAVQSSEGVCIHAFRWAGDRTLYCVKCGELLKIKRGD